MIWHISLTIKGKNSVPPTLNFDKSLIVSCPMKWWQKFNTSILALVSHLLKLVAVLNVSGRRWMIQIKVWKVFLSAASLEKVRCDMN